MSGEDNELTLHDIVDESTYIQYQKQEQDKILAADENLSKMVQNQRIEKGIEEENEEEAMEKIKQYLMEHNEGKEHNEYLVRGAELQCSCGSHNRKLNLSPCHGVYIKGHPVVHELDCIPGNGFNIPWFGICEKDDLRTATIILTGKNGEELRGLQCNPVIVGIWMDSFDGTKIKDNGNKMTDDPENPVGCNTLTVGSFLVCQHGGIISPVNSGQERTVESKEFKEGWNAYKRVTDWKDDKRIKFLGSKQVLSILPEDKNTKEDSSTEEDVLEEAMQRFGQYVAHNATSEQVLDAMDFLSEFHILSYFQIGEETIKKNHEHNLTELKAAKGNEDSFYTDNAYIENQAEWKNIQFGPNNMAHSGCGIIATYNALLALEGQMGEEDMADLISTYEKDGAVLEGDYGLSPYAIYNYFQSQGYNVEMITSWEQEDINKFGQDHDTIIVTIYNNQDNLMNGLHTINITKKGDKYIAHNAYNEKDGKYAASNSYDTLWEAIVELSDGESKPISFIGISK